MFSISLVGVTVFDLHNLQDLLLATEVLTDQAGICSCLLKVSSYNDFTFGLSVSIKHNLQYPILGPKLCRA